MAEGVETEQFACNRRWHSQSASDTRFMEWGSEEYSEDAVESTGKDEQSQEAPTEPLTNSSEYTDDDELTALTYAHRYGLTASYLDEAPFRTVDAAPSPTTVYADLEDPECTLNISDILNAQNIKDITSPEKWDVDKETTNFLASVVFLGKDDEHIDSLQIDGPVYLSDLKLVEPLLSSDPEIDIRRLKQRNAVAISSHGMEPFEFKDEEGESPAWSTCELRARAETDEVIANEKLDVNEGTVKYVNDIMSLGLPTDEESVFADTDLSAIHPSGPVSPPLLPMSPPPSPARPDTAAMVMQFASTPDDLTAKESALMEKRILERDDGLSPKVSSLQPYNESVDSTSLYSSLHTLKDSSSSPLRNKRIKDLETDVPLIPQDLSESPPKKAKTVSFPEELHTAILSSDIDELPSDPERDIGSCIAEVVTPFAETAIHKVENEQLVEFDTTMRVVVPDVRDIEPSPPWKASSNNETMPTSYNELLECVRRDLSKDEEKWSGVSQVEKLLSWTPFPPYLGKVQLAETFDDGSLARYMAEISFEEQVDVDALVWNPQGLRMLDSEGSDDKELEAFVSDGEEDLTETHSAKADTSEAPPSHRSVAPIANKPEGERSDPRRQDMQALLRKRKLELEGGNDSKRPTKQLDQDDPDTKHGYNIKTKPTIIDAIDHVGGLSNFMHLHGEQAKVSNMLTKQQLPPRQRVAPPAIMVEPEVGKNENTICGLSLSVPEIKDAEKARSVVLCSNFSANRTLVRQISISLPSIDLVERDLIARPAKNGQAASKHGCRYEADITVSPSTGLILTTLQKLKQKPLPGQSTFFSVRDHVREVAVRYERLIVLVNEARQPVDGDSSLTGSLDETDTEALSDLIGFGAVLSTDIEVHYIAGGEQELAKWIAALISRHSGSDVGTKLLHDETLWERFLRHAGLNAYAAQAILSELKRSEASQLERNSSTMNSLTAPLHGLAAFVEMRVEKRVERFGALMGGDRVLSRVSDVIDSHWMSASNMTR